MILVQTREQFDAALTQLLQASVIAVDTETTGLHPHMGDNLVGISTFCKYTYDSNYFLSFYFPFRHEPAGGAYNLFNQSDNIEPEWIRELESAFIRDDLTLIFHNFKFDAKMLDKEMIRIRPGVSKIYDTMVMAQMVDENTVHSLKGLGALYYGEHVRNEERELKKLVNKFGGYHKVLPADMGPYACRDAELTYKLCYDLGNKLVEQDLLSLWEKEEQFLHVLKNMEQEGIEIDTLLASQLSAQAQQQLHRLEGEIGFDPLKLDQLARTLHAPQPRGLGLPYDPEMVAKRKTLEFPDGLPLMGEDILQRLNHPLADKVLEFRGLVKADSTWYTGWRDKASPAGRIHPEYNSSAGKEKYGTVTGRLSSSWPNIQQMPRDPKSYVKKLLLPPEGYQLIEFDYSQAELRLAACYAEDQAYLEAFKAGIDAHSDTAERVGITRQAAKHAAFTTIYGGGAKRLAATIEKLEWQEAGRRINFSVAEAREILQAYFSLHPTLRQISKVAEEKARTQLYVRLWNGKRRHFLATEHWAFHKAFNSVIQGGVSQIMVDTMLAIAAEPRPYRMALQVHDSLVFEVPIENQEVHCKEIKDIMEWPGEKFAVPFPVESKLIRDRGEVINI